MPESRPADAGPDSLLEELSDPDRASGLVVLTSSRRLCRVLIAAHSRQMLAGGAAAWSTPAIYFWQDWLTRLVDDADAGGHTSLLPSAEP